MTIHYWEEPDPFIEGRMDRMEAEYHAVETAISEAHYYVRVADVKKQNYTWKDYLQCLEDKLEANLRFNLR